ncbi:MAG: hypothetical protein HYS17_01270 [Micavibrio aeruginosavorus]|uniref:Uncharacterized protein n=1 Tax=Micavibrio aeruginosavorus TaxID=349221 RepID=A0A7T5UH03_9BACT|nr:MAG: hypothetical protein HYS17_01270 [Micavibrio aeruginosavorus]
MVSNNDHDEYDPSMEEEGEDFSYDDSVEGDDFSADESWDDGYEEESAEGGEEEKIPQKHKKKGGLFNVIVIVLAVLGGGVFMYFQFGTKPPAPPVAAEAEQTPLDAASTEASALPSEDVASAMPSPVEAVPSLNSGHGTAAEPLLPEPEESLDKALGGSEGAAGERVVEAEPESVNSSGTEPVSIEPVSLETVDVASAPPMPTSISEPAAPLAEPQSSGAFDPSLPSAQDILLDRAAGTEGMTKQGGAVSSSASVDATADRTAAIDQKLSVLIARLDSFEGRIANLESGLHKVSSEASGASVVSSAEVSSLKEAVMALEQKLSILGQEKGSAVEKAAANEIPVEKPTFVPAINESIDGSEEEPSPASDVGAEKEPLRVTTASVKVKDAAPKPARAGSRSSEASSDSWVLRSAQPGVAMVSSKKTGDMKTVRVGDLLPGIGRITSIDKQGGRWVVLGTQGSLSH